MTPFDPVDLAREITARLPEQAQLTPEGVEELVLVVTAAVEAMQRRAFEHRRDAFFKGFDVHTPTV